MSISSDTGITVTGGGQVSAVPDVFVLSVGAEATSPRAAEATSQASAALTRMRDVALAHGVSAEHLTTRGLSLRQAYDREGQPRGIQCELSLTIRSSELALAGELASTCVEAGGDEARLQGVAFEHLDPRELYVRAREAAFADASARARQFAALAGRSLGPVERISEGGYGGTDGGYAVRALAAPPVGIPISAGTLDVSTSVTVRWAWAVDA
jgi:uncharacterized protein YggE